jgi:hypothetical protein
MMQNTNTGHAPIVICDSCGEPITNGGLAVYLCPNPEADTSPILFAHKLLCHDILEEEHKKPGDTLGWAELAWLPDYLSHNLGLVKTEE